MIVPFRRPGKTGLPAESPCPGPSGVCIIGAGTRFLSGISIYTIRLANALATSHRVSLILMRQLLPSQLYPGRQRVGTELTSIAPNPAVKVFDGVDWYWFPSMLRALRFLSRERPEFVVLEWWSGTVLHSYLALALLARLLGGRVIIEFHEVLDTGEQRMLMARSYVRLLAPLVVRLASGFVAHSEYDRGILKRRYGLGSRPVQIIPHGPYDHYACAPVRKAS